MPGAPRDRPAAAHTRSGWRSDHPRRPVRTWHGVTLAPSNLAGAMTSTCVDRVELRVRLPPPCVTITDRPLDGTGQGERLPDAGCATRRTAAPPAQQAWTGGGVWIAPASLEAKSLPNTINLPFFPAARSSFPRYSFGGMYLQAECRRSVLYQSTHSRVASMTSSGPAPRPFPLDELFLVRLFSDSAAALS